MQALLPFHGVQRTSRPTFSGTTVEARQANRPHTSRQRAKVLELIRDRGPIGATDNELERELGMPGNTIRPRRRELETAGQVIDSGRRRPTSSGRPAIVWVAAEIGRTESEAQPCG